MRTYLWGSKDINEPDALWQIPICIACGGKREREKNEINKSTPTGSGLFLITVHNERATIGVCD
jgi:hypothetical protein